MTYNRAYYETHRKEHIARQRKYLDAGGREKHNAWCQQKRTALRLRAIEFLGGKCVDCGATDERVLQFDHVPGRGEKERNTLSSTTWETCLVEMAKCDLVCANCHCIRTRERPKHKSREYDPNSAAGANYVQS